MHDKLKTEAKRIPWTGIIITALIGYLTFHENPGHRKLGQLLAVLFIPKK